MQNRTRNGIGIHTVAYTLSILLIVLYAYVDGIGLNLVYGKITIAVLSMVFAVTLILVVDERIRVSSSELLLVLLMAVILFARNRNLGTKEYFPEVVMSLMFVFYLFAKNTDWLHKLMGLMILAGIVASVSTWYFYFFPEAYTAYVQQVMPEHVVYLIYNYSTNQMAGLTLNPVVNAGIMLYGIAALLVVHQESRLLRKHLWAKLLLLFFCVSLLLTAKRSTILFGIAAYIFCYMTLGRVKNKWIKLIGIGLIILLLLLALIQFVPALSTFVTKASTENPELDTIAIRFDYYSKSWNIFKSSPIIGIGWGGIKTNFGGFDYGVMRSSHNVFLQLLAETGIVGTILYVLFFVTNFWRVYKMARRYSFSVGHWKGVITFSIFIQVFFLLYCFTGNPLYDPLFFYIYLLACTLGRNMEYHVKTLSQKQVSFYA